MSRDRSIGDRIAGMLSGQVSEDWPVRERIAIAGGPRAGKTTAAEGLHGCCVHTDSLIGDLEWSEASERVSEWFDDCTVDVIEGVAVPRALRKWLDRNPTGKPVDRVIYITGAKRTLTDGQARMSKACRTVWEQVLPELERRGVAIEVR